MKAQSIHDGGKRQRKVPVPAVGTQTFLPAKAVALTVEDKPPFRKVLPGNHSGVPAKPARVQGKMAPPRTTRWRGSIIVANVIEYTRR